MHLQTMSVVANKITYKTKKDLEAKPKIKHISLTASTAWTKDDKFALYTSLKAFESERHRVAIPTKSKKEIEQALEYYVERGFKRITQPLLRQRKSRTQESPRIPIVQWAKELSDNYTFKSLISNVAHILRLIAMFEDIPDAITTEQIDFRHIYHLLADASDGKIVTKEVMDSLPMDKGICLAAATVNEIDKTIHIAMQNYLNMTNTASEESNTDKKPNIELIGEAVLFFATKSNYNPFSISDIYLDLE